MAKNSKSLVNGVLLFNKRHGVTSHDCVSIVRRAFKTRRVGHFGTLDPFASGLLVMGIGEGTKLSPFLLEGEKEYVGVVSLGEERDTLDIDGKCVKKEPVPSFSKEKLKAVLKEFVGEITQTPPIYSAIKVAGKPLYKYARNNETVAIPKRRVTVFDLELIDIKDSATFEIRVKCSKGTYIRTLAVDIAKRLGTVGFLQSLVRHRSGSFNLIDSLSEDDLSSSKFDKVISPKEALSFMPLYELNYDLKQVVQNGGKIPIPSKYLHVAEGKQFRLTFEGKLLRVSVSKSGYFVSLRGFNL